MVSVCIQSESRKIRTRITPNTDTFHAVVFPPFSLLGRIASKIYYERSICNVAIPQWKTQYWYLRDDIKEWNPYVVSLQIG